MCDLQGSRFQVEEAHSKRLPVLFHGLGWFFFLPSSHLGAALDPLGRLCELCSLPGLEQVGRMVLAVETSSAIP